MDLAALFGLCGLISAVAIRLSMAIASRYGIMDSPGGHKQHQQRTPFVGGFGILAVVMVVYLLADRSLIISGPVPLPGILAGALAIFCIGLADDIWHLTFKSRLLVQTVVALSAIIHGGMALHSFGELWPGVDVQLADWAIPVTVVAVIGLINAVNMIDGIDGLSGAVCFGSLALLAVLAQHTDNGGAAILLVAMMGGVAGFLVFNLRYSGNRKAKVFLGDNGSTLLGFVLAWLFIAMSQGDRPVMTPVTALWLFALPLMDTVAVMLRRIWLGKSPFRPDRSHLHHLFIRAGYRVPDIVALAFLMQIALGVVGIGGLLLAVPEYLMFWLFLLLFALYLLCVARPWRLIPWLERINRRLGLPSIYVSGVFVGYFPAHQHGEILAYVIAILGRSYGYQVSVYQNARMGSAGFDAYCVVHVPVEGNEQLIAAIQRDAIRLRRRLAALPGVGVRLFLCRRDQLDDWAKTHLDAVNSVRGRAMRDERRGERRGARDILLYSAESGDDLLAGLSIGFEVSVPPA